MKFAELDATESKTSAAGDVKECNFKIPRRHVQKKKKKKSFIH